MPGFDPTKPLFDQCVTTLFVKNANPAMFQLSVSDSEAFTALAEAYGFHAPSLAGALALDHETAALHIPIE
jgi:hypothetical protein